MGSPQEVRGPIVGKFVETSFRNGKITIPFHFGRQGLVSNAMSAKLDHAAIAGYKVINPRFTSSDQGILDELSVIASHPLDRAPIISLGLAVSLSGFGQYSRPFESLGDSNLKYMVRAIVDPLVDEPYYTPSDIARKALLREDMVYSDGKKKDWDTGELVSHLAIALAERGRVFHGLDEHATRIESKFRWPANLARMMGTAYLFGNGRTVDEEMQASAKEAMQKDFETVVNATDPTYSEKFALAAQANRLAGNVVINVKY